MNGRKVRIMWLIDAEEFEGLFENQIALGNDPYHAAMDALQDATAVDAEPVRQWIPCSERMPEEGQSVLAVVDGNVREAGYSYDAFSGSGFYRDAREIEWWMPLPDPPKRGADNAAD